MKKQQPLVSIIVPVYQVEKYLRECVESIEKQTLTDREVILVDDGSVDASGAICDNLAKEYADIRVIHKKNGGLASARNAGLDMAQGSYVGFVDSDDCIAPDMYESLYSAMTATESRIACCSWRRMIDEDGEWKLLLPESGSGLPERILTAKEAVKELFLGRGTTYSACDKLFEKTIFDHSRFPGENLPSEDIPCIYHILSHCEKTVHIGASKYYYRIVRGSISTDCFKPKNISTLHYMEQVIQDARSRFPELEKEARFALMQCAGSMYARLLESADVRNLKSIEKELKDTVRKNLKHCFTNSCFSGNARLVYLMIALGIYPCFYKIRRKRTERD